MSSQSHRDIKRKTRILNDLARFDFNITRLCGHYGISRDTYYRWKKQFRDGGEKALINSKPCPENPSIRICKEIEEKIIQVRKDHNLGPQRISWYLLRYYNMRVSQSGVRSVLLRNKMQYLPRHKRRSPGPIYKRYEKITPGHQVQVDVKICIFQRNGNKIKRYQYTAIDDATRVRCLKIYSRHTQSNAINFIDHIIEKFPFRIKQIRTDNGSEFQATFHWHCHDQGLEHVYIKKASPHLNGKVERSHKTDKEEFYQFLEYKDDQDLKQKLDHWEQFYNFSRPHGSHSGKTPYEVLKERLS